MPASRRVACRSAVLRSSHPPMGGVSAVPPNRGRRKVWVKRTYVVGTGDDELAALRDLAARLEGSR
jgi:hypothetical protein